MGTHGVRTFSVDEKSPTSPIRRTTHHRTQSSLSGADFTTSSTTNTTAPFLKQILWIGTLGTRTSLWSPSLRTRVSATLRADPYRNEVVWVEDGVFEGAYDEFCHQVLWPVLHYEVPDAPREGVGYREYVEVNRRVAEKIRECWKEGDVVWVNDYHLMLVPRMLRAMGVGGTIGFFLHVSFPSSEIIRCLPVRVPLLRGILGADLVGFQTANYARHFRQTCGRVLGVEALPRGVTSGAHTTTTTSTGSGLTRFVTVSVFPMGIDVSRLKERRKSPEVEEWVQVLKSRYKSGGGKDQEKQKVKLVVGRDKLDDIQGVKQKVQAFELFLEKYPEWVGRVVLIQIALPAPPPPPLSSETSTDITSAILSKVAQINSRWSSLTYQPVIFLHTAEVDWNQYLALLSVADAFLVTSLREGMALRSHEFVVSDQEGTLILSEFAGSYSYSGFRSCIAINPWDTRGTAEAIAQALTMGKEEARGRWEELSEHVETQTAQAFVRGFLSRCVR
ncbi:glycosyl transferase, partial [Dendrothele bispora CBS 962.96]